MLKTLVKYLRSLFGSHTYEKFVIVCRSRTGSNLLVSLLNDHPHIVAEGEIFARLNERATFEIWNNFFNKKWPWIKAVGFKIFYYHPLDSDDRQVWSYILDDPCIKIIHLKRKNKIRTVVSRLLAEHHNQWQLKHPNNPPENKAIEINVDQLIDEIEQSYAWENQLDQSSISNPVLEIYYEEMVQNVEHNFQKICSFINVEYVPVKSPLRKQNPEPLSELISNYNEVVRAINQTPFSNQLSE